MEPNNAENVSFGKPKATGALFYAPKGTTVPTNATTELPEAFRNVGFISEDGLVNATETDTETVNDWSGQEVLSGQTSFAEMFTYNMLEVNANSMRHYYGEDNVELDGEGNITAIHVKPAELEEVVFVAEVVLTGGRIKRVVVPRGKFVDRSGEISYVNSEAVTYPVQLKAYPIADTSTHSEYFASVAS